MAVSKSPFLVITQQGTPEVVKRDTQKVLLLKEASMRVRSTSGVADYSTIM